MTQTLTLLPFVKQFLYADHIFSQAPGQTGKLFPDTDTENLAICVPGVGSTKPFCVLMVDTMPDIQLMFNGQCFPRYRYEQNEKEKQGQLLEDTQEIQCIDNITDATLKKFRVHYNDNTISKDTIFYYVYGVFHAPAYRKRFANDLSKDLPRIPMASDFHAFAKAGKELAKLHLNYETCKEYPLEVVHTQLEDPRPEHFQIGHKAMRFAGDEQSALIVNDHIRLEGIPAEAHLYEVNGRTPLGWFIDRYRITTDKHSGIVNDPNGWFDDPEDLIRAFRRIVHVSVETMSIVESLPKSFKGSLAG